MQKETKQFSYFLFLWKCMHWSYKINFQILYKVFEYFEINCKYLSAQKVKKKITVAFY